MLRCEFRKEFYQSGKSVPVLNWILIPILPHFFKPLSVLYLREEFTLL